MAGLKGANCRHDFHPFVEGASRRQWTDKALAHIDRPDFAYKGRQYTAYEATQRQRAIEAKMRSLKLDLLMYEEAGLEEEYRNTAIRLQRWRQEYRQFSAAAGLREQTERAQVYGFGRGPAARARAAAQRWTDSGKRDILEQRGPRGVKEKALKEAGRKPPISGAITNPESKPARQHASRYYGLVRSMKTDCRRIAENTGLPLEEIERIKSFVFLEKHDLGDGIRRFDPSFEMAESWQRLIDGKNIQPHDLTLLRHEIMERQLMLEGMTQDEAHILTSKKYNYRGDAKAYYDSLEKHQKRRK